MIMVLDNAVLRPPEPKDAEYLYRYRNDWETIQDLVGFTIGFSVKDILDWLEKKRTSSEDIVWTIADKLDDHCIGYKGLYKINYQSGTASTGQMIGDKSYWGKGVATQVKRAVIDFAFNFLRLRRIDTTLIAGKIPSIRLNERCGFTREGVLRQHLFKNGRYHDVEIWGILESEWRAVKEREAEERKARELNAIQGAQQGSD